MYINRKIEPFFTKLKDIYSVLAVTGPRQAGKTTFLKNQMPKNATYFSFDDPDIKLIFEKDIKKFEKHFLKREEINILDEVQNAAEPGQKIKYLADSGYRLWITSSSEILLSASVLAYLVGRVSIIRMYPLSLNEFFRAKDISVLIENIQLRETEEHIRYGGYPKVVLTSEPDFKKVVLQDLYETMILKDIVKTFSISDVRAIEQISEYFSFNTGTQLSLENLSRLVGLSVPTLKKYLDAMEKSYLLYYAKPFFTNKTRELIKQPKVYFLDTGLRNAIRRNFEIDGNGFENYVVTELIKAGFKPKYWRTKTKLEVDIIIDKDNEIIPIEVKMTETKINYALKAFIEEYKPKRAFIAILNGEPRSVTISGCEVKYSTVYDLISELKDNKF